MFNNKIQAKQAGDKYYMPKKPCKYGHYCKKYTCNSGCFECLRLREDIQNKQSHLKASKKYYAKNKQLITLKRQQKVLNTPSEILKAAYKNQNQSNSSKAAKKLYKQRHKNRVRQQNKVYRKANLQKYTFYSNNRRARKLQATPIWANLERIKEIYLNCPAGHHVDHIVPLQGNSVCGLHTESNLQYLPAEENLKKSNKLIINYQLV